MSQLKKGAALSYINILLTNIVGLVLTPFIVRSLGDSEYGLYTLIGAFIGYISVMDLGLNNTIVRYVSRYRAEKRIDVEKKFLGTSLIIYVFIAIIVVVLGIIFYYNIDSIFGDALSKKELEKAKLMMIILIFNLAITLPGGAFTAISNAYEKFVFPRAISIIKYIVRSILIIVILRYGADSIGLVLLDTLINIVVIAITFFYVKKNLKVKFDFSKPDSSLLKEIFSYSIWIFVFAMITQLQWRGGQVIIGTTLGTKEVAIYAIGTLLGTYYGAFSGAISNVFLPRATQMIVNNATPEDLTNTMIKVARYSLFSLIIIFIGFLFLGQSFIKLWLGDDYINAYPIALIIMVGYTIPLIQTFANSILEAKKLFKFKILVYLFSIGGGTLLSSFIVGKYGIISVILSIVVGWIVGQIVMNVFFMKKLKLNILSFFYNISKGLIFTFILTTLSAFLISFIPIEGWLELVVKGVLIFVIYSISLYFIGMNQGEKDIFNNLFRKIVKWS